VRFLFVTQVKEREGLIDVSGQRELKHTWKDEVGHIDSKAKEEKYHETV
jgi:hypothetical protein